MKIDLKNFVCQRCGFCCSLSGYVILKRGEPERIAEFLDMDLFDFTRQYTILVNGRRELSLTERENGRCVFLRDDNTCRIHSVKPAQCLGFPYQWRHRDLEKGCEGLRVLRNAECERHSTSSVSSG